MTSQSFPIQMVGLGVTESPICLLVYESFNFYIRKRYHRLNLIKLSCVTGTDRLKWVRCKRAPMHEEVNNGYRLRRSLLFSRHPSGHWIMSGQLPAKLSREFAFYLESGFLVSRVSLSGWEIDPRRPLGVGRRSEVRGWMMTTGEPRHKNKLSTRLLARTVVNAFGILTAHEE